MRHRKSRAWGEINDYENSDSTILWMELYKNSTLFLRFALAVRVLWLVIGFLVSLATGQSVPGLLLLPFVFLYSHYQG